MTRSSKLVAKQCLAGALAAMLWSQSAAAAPLVCVRNAMFGGLDPCVRGLPRFAYVPAIQEDAAPVCISVFDDQFCKDSPQAFDHVFQADGTLVCTINYHQPPISAQCAMNPEQYLWVKHAWPDG